MTGRGVGFLCCSVLSSMTQKLNFLFFQAVFSDAKS
jgi:hypothetical protein